MQLMLTSYPHVHTYSVTTAFFGIFGRIKTTPSQQISVCAPIILYA